MNILLVVYDNGSHVHYFPMGTAYVAAALRNAGHKVTIYNQDVHHYPDEHLTEYLNQHHFDIVGLGIIGGYYQYRKLLAISEAVNAADRRPFYVLGGHGPSPDPVYFLRKTRADAIVIGEGGFSMIELARCLEENLSLAGLAGIAYRIDDEVLINPRRPLIADIDAIPMPAYDLFPIEYYRLERAPCSAANDLIMPVLSGRGCKFNCNFCYRMDKGFRPRSNEAIVAEIEFLKRAYNISYVVFIDELLMSSISRTESLCEAIIAAGVNVKWWCNGRLNYARPELLKLMKAAGCVFINYGIEAMDDESLMKMNKHLNTKQIIRGVEATLAAGISPGLNIIFGNIDEDLAVLRKDVEFLKKYGDASQMRTIRPVTPYPGSPLFDYAVEKGLIAGVEDFYENKHLNSDLLTVNFTKLTDDEFYAALRIANIELIEDYHDKQKTMAIESINKLYRNKDSSFRGFRTT